MTFRSAAEAASLASERRLAEFVYGGGRVDGSGSAIPRQAVGSQYGEGRMPVIEIGLLADDPGCYEFIDDAAGPVEHDPFGQLARPPPPARGVASSRSMSYQLSGSPVA